MSDQQLDLQPVDNSQKLDLQPTEKSTDDILSSAKKTLSNADELDKNTNVENNTDNEKDNKSTLEKVWNTISQPLTDLPSKIAERVGSAIDTRSLNENPHLAYLKGFVHGSLKGLGDVASSLSSPLNIALTASGLGAEGKFGEEAIPISSRISKLLSVPIAVEGGKNIITGKDLPSKVAGLAELAGSAAGMGGKELSEGNLETKSEPVVNNNTTKLDVQPIEQQTVPLKATGSEVPPQPKPEDFQNVIPETVKDLVLKQQMSGRPYADARDIDLQGLAKRGDTAAQKELDIRNKTEQKPLVKVNADNTLELKNPSETTVKKLSLQGYEPTGEVTENNGLILQKIAKGDESNLTAPVDLKPINFGSSDKINSPFPLASDELQKHLELNKGIDYNNPKIENIPLKDILGTQKTLTKSVVDDYQKFGDRPDIEQLPQAGRAPNADNPVAVKVGDKYVLTGGHHRAAADLANGKDTIQAITYPSQNLPDNLSPKVSSTIQLPRELAGAKPRFNMGNKTYQPNFESDLDKALFIIGQKNPSKRDADYLKFVMDNIGLSEDDARVLGRSVKDQIKTQLKGKEPGVVNISKIIGASPQPKASFAYNWPEIGDMYRVDAPGHPLDGSDVSADTLRENNIPVPNENGNGNGNVPPKLPLSDNSGEEIPDAGKQLSLKNNTKKASTFSNIINSPKGVLASVNLHGPFRQALPLIGTKQWWTSWVPMVKSYGSEEAFRTAMDAVKEHPDYEDAIDNGIKFTHLGDLNDREEVIGSKYAEKIPLVRRSNRAYTAYLNTLRMQTYSALKNDAMKAGLNLNDNQLGSQIANFVNNASGRGSLGGMEKNAELLNNIFFSPRLLASRIQMMNPANYIMSNPFVRKQYLKSMLATIGAWGSIASMGKLAGGSVSLDPNSADFGKMKFGNTRIDPGGGFQQFLVAAHKLATGRQTSTTTGRNYELGSKYGLPSRLDVATNFGVSKLTPMLGFVADWMKASTKHPYDVPEGIAKMYTPIFLQDLKEILTEDPTLLSLPKGVNLNKLPLIAPAAVGMGSLTYGRNYQ